MKNPKTTEPLLPLMTALQQADADSRLKNSAFHFLRTDLSRLENREDFMKAFDGLAAAQQILGIIHVEYRKCLDDMRKTLVASYEVRERSLRIWFKEDVKELWEELGDKIKTELPAAKWHVWDKFVQGCFKE